jgi:DNA polymerase III gamma/tau subunit
MQLFEQYHPKSFDEVVGQEKAVRVIKQLAAKGNLAGRAYWLAGPSGTGKSTLGRLIALEVADQFNLDEIDATDLSAAAIREIERKSHCRGLGTKNGRAYLVNEAHGLRKDAVRQLLTTLDTGRIPSHVVWVFTTTDQGAALFDGIDTSPLLSRCCRLPMARFGIVDAFAKLAQRIAQAEGLDGRPLEDYVALVKEQKFNMRAVLQEIEAGAMLAPEPNQNYAAEVADCVSQLFQKEKNHVSLPR